MHDMNFFQGLKQKGSGNNAFVIFIIVFFVIVVLVNGALIGGGLYLFRGIEQEIKELEDYINDPATQQSIKDAERIKQEVDLTKQYLDLLNAVDGKLDKLDFIDTSLVNELRRLTPENTVYTSAQINGVNVTLNCESTDPTGAMDMYHAFKNSPLFVNVSISGITISEDASVFTINGLLQNEGGDQP